VQTRRLQEAVAAFEESLQLPSISGAPPFVNLGRGGLAAAQLFDGQGRAAERTRAEADAVLNELRSNNRSPPRRI